MGYSPSQNIGTCRGCDNISIRSRSRKLALTETTRRGTDGKRFVRSARNGDYDSLSPGTSIPSLRVQREFNVRDTMSISLVDCVPGARTCEATWQLNTVRSHQLTVAVGIPRCQTCHLPGTLPGSAWSDTGDSKSSSSRPPFLHGSLLEAVKRQSFSVSKS
jgi:hypothetical protein